MENKPLSKKKRRKLALAEVAQLVENYKVEDSGRGEVSRTIIGILSKYQLNEWVRQKQK